VIQNNTQVVHHEASPATRLQLGGRKGDVLLGACWGEKVHKVWAGEPLPTKAGGMRTRRTRRLLQLGSL
jgi:hypothetical protein